MLPPVVLQEETCPSRGKVKLHLNCTALLNGEQISLPDWEITLQPGCIALGLNEYHGLAGQGEQSPGQGSVVLSNPHEHCDTHGPSHGHQARHPGGQGMESKELSLGT